MIKTYGCSDDLIEIEGTKTEYDEIGCYCKTANIVFTYGTTCKVTYGKKVDGKLIGVWKIDVTNKGSGFKELKVCTDENADKYRWHNIVENPDDLPETDFYESPLRCFSDQILVRFKDGTYGVATCYKYKGTDKKFFVFGVMDDEMDCYGVCDNTGDDIVKWKYIDKPEGE